MMEQELNEILFDSLNEQGFILQEKCSEEINDKSSISKWHVNTSEHPVSLKEQDTRIDIIIRETDLHNLLSETTLAEKKSFVRSFVKEVKVTGDEVLLTYTIPMLSKGVIEEKLSVLPIVHYGGQ